jgi:hypothetical protein
VKNNRTASRLKEFGILDPLLDANFYRFSFAYLEKSFRGTMKNVGCPKDL